MRRIYSIPSMDCPAEEAVIRNRLRSMQSIGAIEFDLFNRRLSVDQDGTDDSTLLAALDDIGMAATLVDRSGPASAPGERTPSDSDRCAGAACDASPVADPSTGRWRRIAPLALGGLMATLAEGLSLWGVRDSSWPIVLLAIGSIVAGGLPTLRKGFLAVRTFTLNINFLMTVAVVGACVIGAWPEAAMVTFLFAVAELIEERALDRARNAVRSLMTMAPDSASVRQADGSWKDVPAADVPVASIVRVRPGERLPLDGEVVAGASSVNQAPVTGESVPVDKEVGDKVFAGTINESGVLEFRTSGGKDETTLARIIRTVQEAQATRAPTQRFVDSFARVYTPVVCLAALLVALVPWFAFSQPFLPWLYRALVLLVIACPCALVISTPVTVVSGLAAAARRGILVKGGVHLENGRRLRIVALDKTGTVTEGKPALTDVRPVGDADRDGALRIAASLDALSQHPVAQAIAHAWPGERAAVTDFRSLTGRGVEGRIGDEPFFVGNHRLAEERGVCSPEVEAALVEFERQGKTAVVVGTATSVLAVLAVADKPRETSIEAVKQLHAIGLRTVMLSGDNQNTATSIAQAVGIDDARGGLLPDDKVVAIDALIAQEGDVVGMVGDGVNDAPALAKATIGFAMGAAGTDTALETADVALMKDDLRGVPAFVEISRRTAAILAQNIALAIGIKAVFFALALFGTATMWMAVVADMGTSLLVVANGMRLLRAKTETGHRS
ncbi:MAG: heavy metal translocating P-type ATPase [Phycisphaerae bacterium]|nr:heavy metal translocating P-type ATPase [Phycisphaerae bacterium]